MVGDRLAGVDPQDLPEMGERLVVSPLLSKEPRHQEVGPLVVGIDVQGGVEMRHRRLDLSPFHQLIEQRQPQHRHPLMFVWTWSKKYSFPKTGVLNSRNAASLRSFGNRGKGPFACCLDNGRDQC